MASEDPKSALMSEISWWSKSGGTSADAARLRSAIDAFEKSCGNASELDRLRRVVQAAGQEVASLRCQVDALSHVKLVAEMLEQPWLVLRAERMELLAALKALSVEAERHERWGSAREEPGSLPNPSGAKTCQTLCRRRLRSSPGWRVDSGGCGRVAFRLSQ